MEGEDCYACYVEDDGSSGASSPPQESSTVPTSLSPTSRFTRLVQVYFKYRAHLARRDVVYTDAYRSALAAGIIDTVVREDGVLHKDLLTQSRPVQMLCLLSDCVSASPSGEDARVQSAFPYSAVTYEPSGGQHGYARQREWRPMGSITVHNPEDTSTVQPVITRLHCRWSTSPSHGRDVRPQGSRSDERTASPPETDDAATRAEALTQCLDKLQLPESSRDRPLIAFAWSDLRGSVLMRQAIARFAISRRVDVLIVQRSAHRLMQMRDDLRSEVSNAARDARAYVSRGCGGNPLFRAAALALCNSIESDLQAQVGSIATAVGDGSDADTPDSAPALARLFGLDSGTSDGGAFRRAFAVSPERAQRGAERQQAAASREVRRSNELTDQDFRKKLKARWEAGTLSLTELEEMRKTSRSLRATTGSAAEATAGVSLSEETSGTDGVATAFPAFVLPRDPVDDTGKNVAHAFATPTHSRTKVSSSMGAHTPLHLHGVQLYDETGLVPTSVDITDNICDGGSGTCLLGLGLLRELERVAPGAIRRVNPLPSSVQRVLGIGAMNEVVCWASLTLQLGGRLVELEDVPVLRNHAGLLLGNDFLSTVRARLSYDPDTHGHDGTLVMCSSIGTPSLPIPFKHRANAQRADTYAHVATSALATPVAHDVTDSRFVSLNFEVGDDGQASVQIEARTGWREIAADDAIEAIDPYAFTPERVSVPAWSEKLIKCRIPASIAQGVDVALLPLEDSALPDLGVLVAPCVQKPTGDGYAWARVVNTSREAVSIPMLTPIARFIIDPRTSPLSTEYDIEQVMSKIHIGKLDDSGLAKCRAMLERRLQLFRSQLGYAHPMQVEIRTVPGAVPPNAPNRVRPPKEVAALEKMADDLYKQDIIEPANRSPFNALPMIVWKPDGSLRPVVDWRSLNLISEKDTYPLPNVDANLAALGKADWFTTIDLLQGFLQCELTDESKIKTAFTIGNKQWQYKRMPMGLTSSPSSFMRMVDAALRGLPPGIAYAYV